MNVDRGVPRLLADGDLSLPHQAPANVATERRTKPNSVDHAGTISRVLGRIVALVCITIALATAATVVQAGDHRFQLLLDTDDNAATGCTVATSKGPVAGVDQVWTIVVTTSTSAVVVTQIEHQSCVGAALGASVVYATAGWPVNLGIGVSRTGPIEAYVPLSFLPTSGTMKVVVASTNATGGQDTAGPFLIALGAPGGGPGAAAAIPLSPWVALSAALLIAGLVARWRRVDRRRAALMVFCVAIACTGLVFAATVILDGNIGDWAGVSQVAGNPKGSAPIDANIVGVFYQSDANNLYFRIDADLRLDTVANQAPTVNAGSDQAIVLPAMANLAGSAGDDGLPNPPGVLTTTWSVVSGPGSVTFGNAHALTTTATFATQGTYVLRLTADDSALSTSSTLQVAVSSVGSVGPQIVPIPDSTIVLGTRFQQVVQATAANVSQTLTFALPTAPASASLKPAPLIDWTPTLLQLGVNPFTVKVTDSLGNAATTSFNVTVTQVNHPPQLAPQADASIGIGPTFTRTLTATDPDAGDTLTFALVSGPPGMALTGANLSWDTSGVAIGDYPVTVKVTDAAGLSDSKSFTLALLPLVAPVAVDDSYSIHLGQTLAVAAPGVLANDLGPVGASLTAAKTSDPGKGTLNAFGADGSFSYAAPAVAAGPTFQPMLKWGTNFPSDGIAGGTGNPRIADVFGNGKPVIFVAHEPYNNTGIAAIDGSTGAELWWVYGELPAPYSGCHIGPDNIWEQLAVGDIDDSGVPAVVTPAWCDADSNVGAYVSRMVALDARTGAVKWLSPPLGAYIFTAYNSAFYYYPMTYSVMPAIARLHAAETPSVLFKNTASGYLDNDATQPLACTQFQATSTLNDCTGVLALNGADGTIRQGFVAPNDGQADGGGYNPSAFAVADLTRSGTLNVMANGAVWDADANLLSNRLGTEFDSLAVAKLDDSGQLSIISYETGPYQSSLIVARHADGSVQWQSPLNTCVGSGCGQLSVADIDGDGLPEILATSFQKLWVYDVHGQIKWVRDYGTYPGNPGEPLFTRFKRPAAFDLDGTGIATIIVPTTLGLDFADGATGKTKVNLLWSDLEAQAPLNVCGSYQGGFGASAIVADIDGSGHASVVVSYPPDQYPQSQCVFAFTAPNNDWRPAPTVFNEGGYHFSNVDNIGTIPATEANNFADPRTNVYGNQPQLLTPVNPAVNTTTTFQYTASTASLTSAPATVTITLVPNNPPPVFTSTPPTEYVSGPLTYAAHAFDPEPGDTITYSIVLTAGNGAYNCTIDPASGVLACPNLPNGPQFIVLAATDINGLVANQAISLTQSAGPATVPNVVGASQTAAAATLANAGFVTGNASSIYFAAPVNQVLTQYPGAGATALLGSAITLQVSLGLQPQPIPNLVGLTLTQARSLLVGLGFTVIVNPVSSLTAPGNEVVGQGPAFGMTLAPPGAVTLTVSTGPPLTGTVAQVIVAPGPSALRVVGESIAYRATAVFTDNTSADVTISALWNSSMPTTASIDSTGGAKALNGGATTISAEISGVTGHSTLNVVTRSPGDNVNPVAQITAPTDGSSVSTLTTVTGTASDANFLRYELALAPAGTTDWTVIGAGTTAVTGGTLGTLDPTTLINGVYTLQLTVFDRNGNQTTATVALQVMGGQKPGLFTLTYQDLNLPAAGIPVTVTRTYDSRDKGQGDFGVGWRLGLNTLRISESGVMGAGWLSIYQSLNYALVPGNSHFVSITLPDNSVQTFDLQLTPNTSVIVPITTLQASYVPEPGTVGTLAALDNTNVIIADSQPGPITLLDDTTLSTFDPTHYRYTALDGTQIDLDRNLGVTQVTDRNGNSVTFGIGGIISSSGPSVVVARDNQGRITQITDPLGNAQTYVYNGNGDLVSHTTATGLTSHYAYDYQHNLIDIQDPAGNHAARNTYDAAGHLIATTDASGNTITFANDQAAQRMVVTDHLGNPTISDYDAMGNVTAMTDALGHVWTYTYDSRNNQLTETDALGRVIKQTYDAANNVLSRTDADGNTTTFSFNAGQQLASMTDPQGKTITAAYDAAGNVTQFTNAEGITIQHTYDATGHLLTTTDARGGVSRFTTNAAGQVTSATDPLGNVTTVSYDANGQALRQSRTRALPGGGTETITLQSTYDADGRLIMTTGALGHQTTQTYSDLGDGQRLASVTDTLGRVTLFDYDLAANQFRTTFPDGTVEITNVDANGHELSHTDRDGRTTTFEYDAVGRQTKVTYSDGTSTTTTYDAIGRVLSKTDARGNTTSYAYSPNAQTVTDALGHATTVNFNGNSQPVSSLDALGRITTFAYNGRGKLTLTTFPDGSTASSAYDAAGQRTSVTDPAGRTTQMTYDLVGRLAGVTDALGGLTTYTYDEVGNRLTQTNATGHTTQMEYDALSRLTRRTLPLGQQESFVYDAVDKLVSHTDFDGQTSTFTYDNADRLAQQILPGGIVIPYVFTSTGLRTQAGGDSYAYDNRGRLVQEFKASGDVITYTYDAVGNRTSVATPQATTTYTFDNLNRLATASDASGATTYTYDAVANLASTAYPNGVTTLYGYDTLNRLVQIAHNGPSGLLASYAYTLGPAGDRLQVVEAGPATTGRTVSYAYDGLTRLKQETIHEPGMAGDATIAYTYDAVSNRTQMARNGVITTYTYDSNNRLLAEATGSNSITYAYDASGRTTNRQTGPQIDTYSYDAESRLVAANLQTGPTPGSASYTYDVDGLRTSRTIGGATTAFLVDKNRPFGQVLSEKTGSAVTTYTYGLGLIQQTPSVGSPHFYQHDGQLSTRQLTTAAGSVSDTYTYDAYGVSLSTAGSTPNAYQYTGEQFDPSLGFYYLRARYMSPSTGRFWSMDSDTGSEADPASLHRYLYAHASPVSRVDPTGHDDANLTSIMTAQLIYGSLLTIGRPLLVAGLSWLNGGQPNALSVGGFGSAGVEHNLPWKGSVGLDVVVGGEVTIAPGLRKLYVTGFGGLEFFVGGTLGGTAYESVVRDVLYGFGFSSESGAYEAYHWNYKEKLGAGWQDFNFAGASAGGIWAGYGGENGSQEAIFGVSGNMHVSALGLGAVVSYTRDPFGKVPLFALKAAAGVADAYMNDRLLTQLPLAAGTGPLNGGQRLALDLLSGGSVIAWVGLIYNRGY